MSLYDPSVRRQIVPIHPEGYVFIVAFAIGSLILHWFWLPLGWIGALLTLWCAYFFRDPPRVTPDRDGLVVAPADGYVCSIGLSRRRRNSASARPMQRVSIFMSVFDCHVNRAPIPAASRASPTSPACSSTPISTRRAGQRAQRLS